MKKKIKPIIQLIKQKHRDSDVIFFNLSNNRSLFNLLRNIPHITYSSTHRKWYLKVKDFDLKWIFDYLKDYAYIDYHELKNSSSKTTAKNKCIKPLSTE